MISSNETNIQKMLIFCAFERSSFEEISEKWNDPFDSIWLKLATAASYAVQFFASLIMLAFVAYETGGLAGHYRTLINQLLSYLYGSVRFFCKILILIMK